MPFDFTSDKSKDTPTQRKNFTYARRSEAAYAVALRKIAGHVGHIVEAFPPGTTESADVISRTLRQYSQTLRPWAEATAKRMLAEVARRDEQVWAGIAKNMSRALRQEIAQAPVGERLRQLMAEQVHLITSLPLEAAQRVHNLTQEGLLDATRHDEIREMILASGSVTKSRANLIARTEVARTASSLTMARAEYIGSDGYVWRTARDRDVRQSHRQMEGKFVPWSEAPVLSDGTQTHAGMIYNCRCYPEPVIPDNFE